MADCELYVPKGRPGSYGDRALDDLRYCPFRRTLRVIDSASCVIVRASELHAIVPIDRLKLSCSTHAHGKPKHSFISNRHYLQTPHSCFVISGYVPALESGLKREMVYQEWVSSTAELVLVVGLNGGAPIPGEV